MTKEVSLSALPNPLARLKINVLPVYKLNQNPVPLIRKEI
jgi:hypothetical protein